MRGDIYTYTKNSAINKLVYTFSVDTYKALLFREFLVNNMSNQLQLINWKGELWQGYITNNPVDLVTKGRWSTGTPGQSGYKRENVQFTVEFQGVKISG